MMKSKYVSCQNRRVNTSAYVPRLVRGIYGSRSGIGSLDPADKPRDVERLDLPGECDRIPKYFIALAFSFLPMMAFSTDSLYCPAKQGYINIGMSSSQVMALCGQPMSKQDSSEIQVAQKIPVTQLIYTTLNQGSVYSGLTSYYTMWSLPSGSNGTSLRFNVVNNKVTAVDINGSDTNAMSICGGTNVQIGDDVNKVYSACGDPSLVNETFINQPIAKSQHPEVWIYQLNPYQPTIHLTFIDGKLQSIE